MNLINPTTNPVASSLVNVKDAFDIDLVGRKRYIREQLFLTCPDAETVLYSEAIVNSLKAKFPGANLSGYVPDLCYRINYAELSADAIIENALASLDVSNAAVYLIFHEVGIAFRLDSGHLSDIIYTLVDLQEELCIMDEKEQWVIFHSRDGEWRWGFCNIHADLYAEGSRPLYIYSKTSGKVDLINTLCTVAPEIGAEFDDRKFIECIHRFNKCGADTGTYILRGKELWIEITLEKNEGSFFWHCYTFDPQLVGQWESYFRSLKVGSLQ